MEITFCDNVEFNSQWASGGKLTWFNYDNKTTIINNNSSCLSWLDDLTSYFQFEDFFLVQCLISVMSPISLESVGSIPSNLFTRGSFHVKLSFAFCLSVFLSSCLFVFLSSCLLVFLSLFFSRSEKHIPVDIFLFQKD
jgi:hypothetical protein